MNKNARAIVVIGAGRSGMSFLCQMLESMGVELGTPLVEPDEYNTRGYYERSDIKALRRAWFRADGNKPGEQKAIRNDLLEIARAQFEHSPLWALKDAGEQCFVHVWQDIFDELDVDARYLLAIRDPAAMHASVNAMKGESDHKHKLANVIKLWDAYYLELLAHVQALPVSYENWFTGQGQLDQVKHIQNYTGLVTFVDFNNLLDPEMCHHKETCEPPPALYAEFRSAASVGELLTYKVRDPIIKSTGRWRTPLLFGTATLGQVRVEWANARQYVTLPVNLSHTAMIQPYHILSPLRYHVAEAQNFIVQRALENEGEYEWVFLLEDDVVIPPNTLLQFAKWMHDGRFPVVSGWYNVKCNPPEPMFFRGRGNGPVCYSVNEVSEKTKVINEDLALSGIMCDGVPTGCLLLSVKLLRVVAEHSPLISVNRLAHADGTQHEVRMREVFHTMREAGFDPETDGYWMKLGTSDLEFCDRVIDGGLLKEAGYEYAAGLEWPFPVDTSIRCQHIDLSSGTMF